MKVVILAGGFGTRISEESYLKPKPMIEIGGMPILWHIMKLYFHQGFDDFIICCGYKAHVIKEFFNNYYLHNCDVTFDFSNGHAQKVHVNNAEPWRVTLIDTGLETMTGGRIKRIEPYLEGEPFMLTYGDGVSDVDLKALVAFHKTHKKTATLTTVQPEGRFGILSINNQVITDFREKKQNDTGWINAGFMVMEPDIFRYLKDDTTILEQAPLTTLAKEENLMAYQHRGFWQCLDTQRDKQTLEAHWVKGDAPWRIW